MSNDSLPLVKSSFPLLPTGARKPVCQFEPCVSIPIYPIDEPSYSECTIKATETRRGPGRRKASAPEATLGKRNSVQTPPTILPFITPLCGSPKLKETGFLFHNLILGSTVLREHKLLPGGS